MKRIGILGGGQLGLMLAESIIRHGGAVRLYEQDRAAPLVQVLKDVVCDDWTNTRSLERFFDGCDAVTYEFENVESTELFQFEKRTPVYPSVHVLYTTQDRAREKKFLADSGLPHVPFAHFKDRGELENAVESVGYPCIIKTTRGGYDGKGQQLLKDSSALQTLHNGDVEGVVERAIDIKMELSCIVARSPQGEEVCFPVFENVHSDHILDTTLVPARISPSLASAIEEIALQTARRLDAIGLLTIEFFLTEVDETIQTGTVFGAWQIFINELAPRPHNSGHVSMKACSISQFDALARILLDIPIGRPEILAPGYFCMGNLLGDVWLAQGDSQQLNLQALSKFPDVIDVVLYGKEEPRAKRKMGHFVTYAHSAERALATAHAFRDALKAPVVLSRGNETR